MAKNNQCAGDHEGHICVLASKEMFSTIAEITQAPEFICFNCGRVADQAKHLCNPMPINE
jgi:hypothetical protein